MKKSLVKKKECHPRPTSSTYFQYSSLGLVLLVRLTTSDTPATRLVVALARLALRWRLLPTTPLQSAVFHGLLQ